ncbi:Serine/threonine phosphatase stp [Paraliobacillus sp. PM-2]|uniref:Stp1/IreP family PP2C-type Ser/Thr phosphatase n=1 Tax=Paraliobacillus sp. PM-2 TaxID=1462524 RepID=UPI00061CADB7|nr:Stp1/IreP family PP2C-type Ser/Thr phosphatase [Paraliobacillus sp. PM-2]CQR47744.1 Serine/threonine phosphatase stp [Paraliobacillus sp. PM-2]
MHYFLTNQGKVRAHNEDNGGVFQNKSDQYLAVVADGMGGHKAGDVASQLVVEHLQEKWQSSEEIKDKTSAENWLKSSIETVNTSVYNYAQNNKECYGMGTTVVAVIYGHDFISVANIGDSRCYLFAEEVLRQVTEDHSLVNELVRSGQISKEDAAFHPRKNVITKALGTEKHIEPDMVNEKWEPGNKLLLCSDGLSNKIEDYELVPFLTDEKPLSDKANALVDTANERGGEDNITLVLSEFRVGKEGDSSC